jgi:hypothetical protein
VIFTVPSNADTSVPVHTALLFLTQLNPGDAKAENGSAIKVSVRMGVKLYHSFSATEERNIEINDFKDSKGSLELLLENTGKIWLEGKIKWELLNTQSGEKSKIPEQDFYSLPGDKRIIKQNLPPNLKKGTYTATALINYGNKDELKVVELEFVN